MWFYYRKDLILKVIIYKGIYLISWIKGGMSKLIFLIKLPYSLKPFLSLSQEVYRKPRSPKVIFSKPDYDYGLNISEDNNIINISEADSEVSNKP